jgi:hypothetical protein
MINVPSGNRKMKGQWIGLYKGTNEGLIVVNVDELHDHFQGVAYLNEGANHMPSSGTFFRTQDKNNKFKFRTGKVMPVNPETGVFDSWENVKKFYDANVTIPEYADVEGSFNNEELCLSWTTDIGTHATCILPKSKADNPSELVPFPNNWAEFKNSVAKMEGRRFLFRGQNTQRRLRTSFHRTGRADLARFVNEDIQMLHKHLSARTRHFFDLSIPDQNGAFFNLVQHHGYPTPLLDWSYSPYVAAFFAYRGISNEEAATAAQEEKVRIFAFDYAKWKADLNQLHQLLTVGPHFSVSEFLAIENERMIPQQAASTITNVDDIETYIKSKESVEKKYLVAIDLPVKERKEVIQELSYMGITAGSLFPGLDGACEELRERNFSN